ncbi:MAG TPA: YceI family protein [Myxococcota bacterium]|nr:YceI family protein [Myxococcota bacterium]
MAKYSIDAERSEVFVEARSNVHPIEIRTQGVCGSIEADVRNGQLDLSSAPRAELEISAELLRSGIDLYDSEIHRRIEVHKYRAIKGQLRDASEIGQGRYRLRGTLSLHGVTRELEGEVTVRAGDDWLEVEGAKTLDMRDFNLEPPKILMLEVQAQINLHAKIRAVRVG